MDLTDPRSIEFRRNKVIDWLHEMNDFNSKNIDIENPEEDGQVILASDDSTEFISVSQRTAMNNNNSDNSEGDSDDNDNHEKPQRIRKKVYTSGVKKTRKQLKRQQLPKLFDNKTKQKRKISKAVVRLQRFVNNIEDANKNKDINYEFQEGAEEEKMIGNYNSTILHFLSPCEMSDETRMKLFSNSDSDTEWSASKSINLQNAFIKQRNNYTKLKLKRVYNRNLICNKNNAKKQRRSSENESVDNENSINKKSDNKILGTKNRITRNKKRNKIIFKASNNTEATEINKKYKTELSIRNKNFDENLSKQTDNIDQETAQKCVAVQEHSVMIPHIMDVDKKNEHSVLTADIFSGSNKNSLEIDVLRDINELNNNLNSDQFVQYRGNDTFMKRAEALTQLVDKNDSSKNLEQQNNSPIENNRQLTTHNLVKNNIDGTVQIYENLLNNKLKDYQSDKSPLRYDCDEYDEILSSQTGECVDKSISGSSAIDLRPGEENIKPTNGNVESIKSNLELRVQDDKCNMNENLKPQVCNDNREKEIILNKSRNEIKTAINIDKNMHGDGKSSLQSCEKVSDTTIKLNKNEVPTLNQTEDLQKPTKISTVNTNQENGIKNKTTNQLDKINLYFEKTCGLTHFYKNKKLSYDKNCKYKSENECSKCVTKTKKRKCTFKIKKPNLNRSVLLSPGWSKVKKGLKELNIPYKKGLKIKIFHNLEKNTSNKLLFMNCESKEYIETTSNSKLIKFKSFSMDDLCKFNDDHQIYQSVKFSKSMNDIHDNNLDFNPAIIDEFRKWFNLYNENFKKLPNINDFNKDPINPKSDDEISSGYVESSQLPDNIKNFAQKGSDTICFQNKLTTHSLITPSSFFVLSNQSHQYFENVVQNKLRLTDCENEATDCNSPDIFEISSKCTITEKNENTALVFNNDQHNSLSDDIVLPSQEIQKSISENKKYRSKKLNDSDSDKNEQTNSISNVTNTVNLDLSYCNDDKINKSLMNVKILHKKLQKRSEKNALNKIQFESIGGGKNDFQLRVNANDTEGRVIIGDEKSNFEINLSYYSK